MSEDKKQVESPMLSPGKASQLNESGFTPVPQDRLSVVYMIFYLLGLGTLLPWNFFITAQGYWMDKFKDVNHTISESTNGYELDKLKILNQTIESTNGTSNIAVAEAKSERSELQITFTSYLSVAAMVPSTIFLMLNTVLSRRIPQKIRLVFSLLVVIAFFIVTMAMVKVDTDTWQKQFFIFTLFTVVIINCNTAIFQGAVFGLGGIFPSQITQAIMNGQALGGIFASVANILSILAGSSPSDSALGYFFTAVIILILALASYFFLPKSDYYNFYVNQTSAKGTELSPISNRSKTVPFLHIFLKIKVYAIAVTLVFMVTLSVFPAITVLVKSSHDDMKSAWNKNYFLPVGCFLMFNVGDYTGRMLAGWFNLPRGKIPWVLILGLLRVAFIPLFMYCNTDPKHYTTAAFNHDAYYLLFMILFSMSGGYLASQAMIHGPKEAEMEHQEAAGAMMAFFLGLGLMLGAGLSNVFVLLV